MSPNEAKLILESLAHGRDPESGHALSALDILEDPEVIRALFIAAKALDDLSKESIGKKAINGLPSTKKHEKKRPNNAGKPWTTEEDNELISSFEGETTIKEIAAKHGRTIGAISARLAHLELIKRKPFYRKKTK